MLHLLNLTVVCTFQNVWNDPLEISSSTIFFPFTNLRTYSSRGGPFMFFADYFQSF